MDKLEIKQPGYTYFGARYYDADLSLWLSVDPLASKYPSLSPYMYCAGNPVMLVDPDGNYFVIWYEVNGKSKSFVFNGNNASEAPKNSYVKAVLKAYQYNVDNGTGGNLIALAWDKKNRINITYDVSSGHSFNNIYWNPNNASLYSDGTVVSPATTLEHEAAHTVHWLYQEDKYWNDVETNDSKYSNKEERRTCTVDESFTAQRNGEAPDDWIRPDHGGVPVGVDDPTSNKPNKDATDKLYEALEKTNYDYSKKKQQANKYLDKNNKR